MVTLMVIFNILLSVAITLESAIQNNLSKSWIFSKEISVVEFRYSEIIVLTLIQIMVLKPMILWNYIGLLILFSSQIKLNIIQINLVNVIHLIDYLLINLGDIFHCFCEGEAPKVKKLNQYITSHQFIQARNQIFFRAGEVSWNEVTFINISSKIKWNKGRGGKFRRCLSFWTVDLT